MSLIISICFFQIGYAYSDKTENCIDRVNGVILRRFSTELKGLILSGTNGDEDVADFCLENDSKYNYSDLQELAKLGQDDVDNFFVDSLYGKYLIIGLINANFNFNVFSSKSFSSIRNELNDKFVDDSKEDWKALLNRGIADGISYYQDYIDAVDRIYKKFSDFRGLVKEGLDNNYICKDGLYTVIGKTNCSCLEGYSWNNSLSSCIENTKNSEEVVTENNASNETIDKLNAPEEVVIPFTDLTKLHKNLTAILYLKNQGVINGYPDGTFKPEKTVNRAELLKIIIEGQGFTPTSSEYNNCFSDIIDTEWYAPYVCYAKSIGWIKGYSDGTFKPTQNVNKVEALKMLLNSQKIEIPTDVSAKPFEDINTTDWFTPFVIKAKELKILEETGTVFNPEGNMTRGGICENLYRLLNILKK